MIVDQGYWHMVIAMWSHDNWHLSILEHARYGQWCLTSRLVMHPNQQVAILTRFCWVPVAIIWEDGFHSLSHLCQLGSKSWYAACPRLHSCLAGTHQIINRTSGIPPISTMSIVDLQFPTKIPIGPAKVIYAFYSGHASVHASRHAHKHIQIHTYMHTF